MDISATVQLEALRTGCAENRCFLVVGLGNPGAKYLHSRHNIGFQVIDDLARFYRIPMRRPSISMPEVSARIGEGAIEGRNVILSQPMDYMNLSGGPICQILKCTGLSVKDMLVVHDDMDLSFGRIKIKSKGGSGGHNGIQSLIDALGGGDFNRLRIGIGRPEESVGVVDHVLSSFTPKEHGMMTRIIGRAREAVVTVLCNGAGAGMNRFNQTLITILS